MSAIYSEKPHNTITIKELCELTGTLHETIRCKLKSGGVRPIGKLTDGRYFVGLFNKDDAKFILDSDFKRYKKEIKMDKYFANDYPFYNTLAMKVIRGGL